MLSCLVLAMGVMMMPSAEGSGAVAPTKDETAACRAWCRAAIDNNGPVRPFSFTRDGRSSVDLLKTWKPERSSRKLDESRTQRAQTWTDPATGLEVRCVSVEYSDFPTVEWTLYFRNTGQADTPVISDIRALDTRFERNADGEFVLHHHRGTTVKADDYEPLTTVMELLNRAKTQESIVHFINFERKKTTGVFGVNLKKQFPGAVKSVTYISPDADDPKPLDFKEASGAVDFTVPATRLYGMVVVAYAGGAAK